MSILAEREFRLVEPNNVRHGCEVGVGRTHIPTAAFQDGTQSRQGQCTHP